MPNLVIPHQQVVAGVAATLVWGHVDENGEPTVVPDDGVVTVAVADSAGGVVLADGAATLSVSAEIEGIYERALTATQTATLDLLTASWSIDGALVATTLIEVRGPHLFTIAEARRYHHTLADTGKYPTSDMVAVRTATENELQDICGRSFTPRWRQTTVNGSNDRALLLPDRDLRAVLSCSIDGTALTSGELAALVPYDSGRVERAAGDIWPWGQENITIARTFGLDRAPEDLKRAALLRFRELINQHIQGASPLATNVSAGGQSQGLQVRQANETMTGNPLVDPVYRRWSLNHNRASSGDDDGATSAAPYSRTMVMYPQGDPLFRRRR